jgi:DNA-binding MarR family transcriptional regulator
MSKPTLLKKKKRASPSRSIIDSPAKLLDQTDTKLEEKATTTLPPVRNDLRILKALRQIIRAIDIHSRKLVTNHKITVPQLVCLLTIIENESITVTEIGLKVYLSASTVIGILDRLEKNGLIQRERDTKDRRLVNVIATPKGYKVATTAPSPLQETFAKAIKELPEDEQLGIVLSLEQIVELMGAQEIVAPPILEARLIDKSTNDDLND